MCTNLEFFVIQSKEPPTSCLLLNEKFADVYFLIEGERLPAHRAILAAQNCYFEGLLYGGLLESQQREITLQAGLQPFMLVLEFLYTGKVSIARAYEGEFSASLLCQFIQLAHEYQLQGALDGACIALTELVQLENVCELLNLVIFYQIGTLVQRCHEYIDEDPASCLKHKTFTKLTQEALISILKRDTFDAAEREIFLAVKAWHEAHPDADMAAVLKHVRFSLLKGDFLFDTVLSSKLLPPEELLAIVLHARQNADMETVRKYMKIYEYPELINHEHNNRIFATRALTASDELPDNLLINLGRICQFNYIVAKFTNRDGSVAVSLSKDGLFWHRKHLSLQPGTKILRASLNDDAQARYLRFECQSTQIFGNSSPLSIDALEIFQVLKFGLINVASFEAGAELTSGKRVRYGDTSAGSEQTDEISYLASGPDGSITFKFVKSFNIKKVCGVFGATPDSFYVCADYTIVPHTVNGNTFCVENYNTNVSSIIFQGKTAGEKYIELRNVECWATPTE